MREGDGFDNPDTDAQADSAYNDRSYDLVLAHLKDDLVAGEEIPPGVTVSFLRSFSRDVTADSFKLREHDREPIGNTIAPGKSAHIAFTSDPALYSRIAIEQPPRTRHALVDFSAGELAKLGFHAIYTPLPRFRLHVRVVHDIHLSDPMSPEDIPYEARATLAGAFNRKLQEKG